MFTGIIEEQGKILDLIHEKNLSRLRVSTRLVKGGTKIGDSVCVNGVCLTVTKKSGTVLTFDLMKETLKATTLGGLKRGGRVNLERALRVGDRLGGHFVTGHVDGIGTIRRVIRLKNYVEFQMAPSSKGLMRYIASKGSVCLDGVSLTIGAVRKNGFSVYLIPHTLEVTSFGSAAAGQPVNIETDILAKYLDRLS